MGLELKKGETTITLLANDEVKDNCLKFSAGAVPDFTADGYLALRGTGGTAIVRGYRSGIADGDGAVRAHSAMVEKVNGAACAEELTAAIREVRWWRYLPHAGLTSWIQVLVALVVLGAALFGLIELLLTSEAPTWVRDGVIGFGALAAMAAFIAAAVNALSIKCR